MGTTLYVWGLGHGNLGFRGGTWGQPFRLVGGAGTWELGVGGTRGQPFRFSGLGHGNLGDLFRFWGLGHGNLV